MKKKSRFITNLVGGLGLDLIIGVGSRTTWSRVPDPVTARNWVMIGAFIAMYLLWEEHKSAHCAWGAFIAALIMALLSPRQSPEVQLAWAWGEHAGYTWSLVSMALPCIFAYAVSNMLMGQPAPE